MKKIENILAIILSSAVMSSCVTLTVNADETFAEETLTNEPILGLRESIAYISEEELNRYVEYMIYISRDADGDGVLTIRDCSAIARKLASNDGDSLPKTADINNDGKIDIRDAAAIANELATK